MNSEKKMSLFGIAYMLPSFILLIVFSIIPIFMSIYFSFTEYNVIRPAQWVGLSNYIRMINDSYVSASLKNTIIYTLITVPCQTLISLLISAIIADRFRNTYGNFVKSSLFIPVLASYILIGSVWSFILEPMGLINNVLSSIGASTINFLGSSTLSLMSICLVAVWRNIGYFLVIIYAGMMDIPDSLYEAGTIDGASKTQLFFYITVPSLKSVLYLVVTLGTIWSFQVFDLVYTMTGGGPGLSTQTLVLTIYNNAFRNYEMGYASAIALLLLVFVLIISMLQRKLMKED